MWPVWDTVVAARSDSLLRYLRQLAGPRELHAASDAALLNRFISDRDEAAFAALVDRHRSMVLHVCLRVAGDLHDAEDAFQAVFLVLARKATTVNPQERLTNWLHGVAFRVALKARCSRIRRQQRNQFLSAPPCDPRTDPLGEVSVRELMTAVDEEIRRLPQSYRLPVILCCFEGHSVEEAARRLGWTQGSVKGRLERGRARLHKRLARRGLTLSAAFAASEISRGAVLAVAVTGLVDSTIRTAMAFMARSIEIPVGSSARATALATDVLKGMVLVQLKVPTILLIAVSLFAMGIVARGIRNASVEPALQPETSTDSAKDTRSKRSSSLNKSRAAVSRMDADFPVAVKGRVLDPAGKPLAGARLYVGYSVRGYAPYIKPPEHLFRETAYPLRGRTDSDGRFEFVFKQSELDAEWLDDSRPTVIAVADRYGPSWTEVSEPNKGAELSLKLVEDLPLSGRILDQRRNPVRGVRVFVRDVVSDSDGAVTRFLRGDFLPEPINWRGSFPTGPLCVTTDAEGRFQLSGLGGNRLVHLALDFEHPGTPCANMTAVTRPSVSTTGSREILGNSFDFVVPEVQPIRGVVRDKATGKPVARMRIISDSRTITDSDGRFEVFGDPKLLFKSVLAEPHSDQPFFRAFCTAHANDGPNAVLNADFDLVRGIPLFGRVLDQSTQKAPGAAVVEYYPLFPNRHSSTLGDWRRTGPPSHARVERDGTYKLVVLPGPGVIAAVASPRNLYATAVVDDQALANFFIGGGKHGGDQLLHTACAGDPQLYYTLDVNQFHAAALISPKEGTESLSVDFALERGRKLAGVVVGTDGKPLAGATVIGLSARPDEETLDSDSFTVCGLATGCRRELLFRHDGQGLGKMLVIEGSQTEPLTVQLQPCGLISGRLVDKNGKPSPGVALRFSRKGRSYFIDGPVQTDQDGRFRATLLPGAKYSCSLFHHGRSIEVGEWELEFGERKDLGDMSLDD
jgi:RNA polymerase sigma factor (sigma-70 family)